jgi:hypothetical protein
MTFDLEDAKKRGCRVFYSGTSPDQARIVCDDLKGDYPIGAAVPLSDGSESIITFTREGLNCARGCHLVNLPREVTVWACASESHDGRQSICEADAEYWCREQRIKGSAAGYAPVTIKLTR